MPIVQKIYGYHVIFTNGSKICDNYGCAFYDSTKDKKHARYKSFRWKSTNIIILVLWLWCRKAITQSNFIGLRLTEKLDGRWLENAIFTREGTRGEDVCRVVRGTYLSYS